MRTKTEKVKKLLEEFNALKAEIFKGGFFAVVKGDSPKEKRYDQLLGFFYPQYRTSGWVNPLENNGGE